MNLPNLNDKSVLVVVDMQLGFETAHKPKTITNCLTLIEHFKVHQRPIVILRYGRNELYSYGAILPQIAKATRNYPLTTKITKFCDSGAWSVMPLFSKKHHMFICGVNIGACIAETALDLAVYDYPVYVVAPACNGTENYVHWESLFPKVINLKPVQMEVLA